MLFSFAECPRVFPKLFVPKNFTLDQDQKIVCVFPEAEPDLNMNHTVDDNPIKFEIELKIFTNYSETGAHATDLERGWDRKKVRCCFSHENCGVMKCSPKEDIKLHCT